MNGALVLFVWVLIFVGTPLRADSDIVLGPSTNSAYSAGNNTPLTRYKSYMRQIVGSYWYPSIDQRYEVLPPGKIHLGFTIHSDGTLSDITILEGKDLKDLVEASLHALKSPVPFKPFSDALIRQVGEKYTDDFTFTVDTKR